jgi:hypothetical protein
MCVVCALCHLSTVDTDTIYSRPTVYQFGTSIIRSTAGEKLIKSYFDFFQSPRFTEVHSQQIRLNYTQYVVELYQAKRKISRLG